MKVTMDIIDKCGMGEDITLCVVFFFSNSYFLRSYHFDGFLPFVNLQLGLHHIRTRLYSLHLKILHDFYKSTLILHLTDVGEQRWPSG